MAAYEPQSWEVQGAHGVTRANDPERFILQHVAPLLYQRTTGSGNGHAEFTSERDFWTNCHQLLLSTVHLKGFRLTDWFPRAPGVYWSARGVDVRRSTWEQETRYDPGLGRFFNPESKMALIEDGGIGTIRLRPRLIDGYYCWLASATTGHQCAGGIPLALPGKLLADANVTWGDTVEVAGHVRFLQDLRLEDVASSVHHARPVIIFVDELRGVGPLGGDVVLTPVALFGDDSHYRHGSLKYTFVQCTAGSDEELDEASHWLEKYAGKHGGRVITNFDEHRPTLADAPLSYQRLVAKSYDRTVIEHLHLHDGSRLADRIDHVFQEQVMSTINVTLGDGTVIHGDMVVANSISGSFNRARESHLDDNLKRAVQQLASQVGAIVQYLDKEAAKKAADDLDTFTREVARPHPRKQWWELSLQGLKEAAVAVRDVGKPILETVGTIVPLLIAKST